MSSDSRDYQGALSAGLEARLIRRSGEWSDGTLRKSEEDLTDVTITTGLDEILAEVAQRNQPLNMR